MTPEEEADIVERGIIANCIMYFSTVVLTRITVSEKEKLMVKEGRYITVKEV